MPYSPTEYWSAVHERDDLSAVGQSALPDGINRWLYRALARNLRRFVGRHRLARPAPARVMDVGAGTGYWVEFWRGRGSRVDGVDIVPLAVERLNERHGESGRFWVADIAEPGSLGGESYDIVTCLNVLLHVTQDDAFERALRNVAGAVAPGGHLLLAEPILKGAAPETPYNPDKHSRARSLATYAAQLQAAGLELVALEAATVLANNPIEAGSDAWRSRFGTWWKFVAGRSKRDPASARWLGPLVYVADGVAIRTRAAPSSKFALFRRPPAR